jgi:hypothetical protein
VCDWVTVKSNGFMYQNKIKNVLRLAQLSFYFIIANFGKQFLPEEATIRPLFMKRYFEIF